MGTPRFDAPSIILAYRDAYRQTNRCEPPIVKYRRGWFKIAADTTFHRRREIEAMTKRLLARPTTPENADG